MPQNGCKPVRNGSFRSSLVFCVKHQHWWHNGQSGEDAIHRVVNTYEEHKYDVVSLQKCREHPLLYFSGRFLYLLDELISFLSYLFWNGTYIDLLRHSYRHSFIQSFIQKFHIVAARRQYLEELHSTIKNPRVPNGKRLWSLHVIFLCLMYWQRHEPASNGRNLLPSPPWCPLLLCSTLSHFFTT